MNYTSDTQEEYWGNVDQKTFELATTKPAGIYLWGVVTNTILDMSKITKDSRIIEIGCGAGTESIILSNIGYKNIVGIDISTKAIKCAKENARKRNLNIEFVQGDATNLPFKNKSFDMAFSGGVMEHIPKLDDAVCEQYRILVKTGKIIFIVPNTYCPWWSIGKPLRALLSKKEEYQMPPIFRTFKSQEVTLLLNKHYFIKIHKSIKCAVLAQTPNNLLKLNIFLEKFIERTPIFKDTLALLFVKGEK